MSEKYYDEINRLPKRKDNYGIIHGDIHTDNFLCIVGKSNFLILMPASLTGMPQILPAPYFYGIERCRAAETQK